MKFNDKDYDEKNKDINRVIKYTFVRSPDVSALSGRANLKGKN